MEGLGELIEQTQVELQTASRLRGRSDYIVLLREENGLYLNRQDEIVDAQILSQRERTFIAAWRTGDDPMLARKLAVMIYAQQWGHPGANAVALLAPVDSFIPGIKDHQFLCDLTFVYVPQVNRS